MDWYDKLSNYFPKSEMKNREHMEALFEQSHVYRKIEANDYIVVYAEYTDFIFIDYLLVFETARGQGIGSKVLQQLKQKNKLVILEAEPADPEDELTEKRLRFYENNGFTLAKNIRYSRKSNADIAFNLLVVYWAPTHVSEHFVLEKMRQVVADIHNFRSDAYYGRNAIVEPDSLSLIK